MISDGDCGEIGGTKIGRGNRSTRRKPATAPLCPPQIPHVTLYIVELDKFQGKRTTVEATQTDVISEIKVISQS
jgi:hypothetical protein